MFNFTYLKIINIQITNLNLKTMPANETNPEKRQRNKKEIEKLIAQQA